MYLYHSLIVIKYILIRPRNGKSRNPKAIVISPTRELCLQIHKYVIFIFSHAPECNDLPNHYGVPPPPGLARISF